MKTESNKHRNALLWNEPNINKKGTFSTLDFSGEFELQQNTIMNCGRTLLQSAAKH